MADPSQSGGNPSTSRQVRSSGDDGDRISNLPEHLICEVLSRLSTKQAVATSGLSKRWRSLWTWVPTLDFDYNRDANTITRTNLLRAISGVFFEHTQWPIRKFRLNWPAICDPYHLDSCFYAAITRNVEEFELLFYNEVPCRLYYCRSAVVMKIKGVVIGEVPSAHLPNLKILHLSRIKYNDLGSVYKFFSGCPVLEELVFEGSQRCDLNIFFVPRCILFTKTLVVLKLCSVEMVLNVPSRVHLPSLKVLRLELIKYRDNRSVRNLLAGCPVLEDMYLERLDCDLVNNFEIASRTLRNLVVKFTVSDEYALEETQMCSHKLQVKTPALQYLSVEDLVCRSFQFGNMPCLVQANIGVYPCEVNIGSMEQAVLGAVRNVKVLTLQHQIMRIFGNVDFFNKCPLFPHVIELDLCEIRCSWELLRHILHKFPQLKHLTLSKICFADETEEECTVQALAVPICLTSHLMTFCFRKFEGSEEEMEYARYIAENAMVLKEMKICSMAVDPERGPVVMGELAMFERVRIVVGSNLIK